MQPSHVAGRLLSKTPVVVHSDWTLSAVQASYCAVDSHSMVHKTAAASVLASERESRNGAARAVAEKSRMRSLAALCCA